MPRRDVLVVTCLGVVVMAPLLLHRGFVLVGDMVFVPHQPWKAQWLGADGSVPRAVPVDALVSELTSVIPGDLLQKAVLLAVLLTAGWGMLHLLRGAATPARIAGAVLYLWNPYVYERLAIGHWALLCGYASLPCVLGAAVRLRAGSAGRAALWCALAAAAWTSPTGGVLAAGLAVAVLAGRPRRLPEAVVPGVLLNLPWLLPGALNAAGSASDITGVVAFAARADTPLGAVGSLLGFGGMWKTSVAPDLQPALLYASLSLLLGVVGTVTAVAFAARAPQRLPGLRSLTVVAAVGLVLALLPTSAFGQQLVEELVRRVPGAGLLRDSQKWLAPYVLLASCGLGLFVDRFLRERRLVAVLCAALPVLAVPTMAWGLSGWFRNATYPREWSTVATALDRAGAAHGRTAVLPWSSYRRFEWAHDRAVLDPAFRFFPGQVLTDDALRIDATQTVRGEDPVARQVGAALGRGQAALELHRLHVRWVLVEKHTPGPVPRLPGRVVHDGPELRLVDLGGPTRTTLSPYARWYYAAGALALAAFGIVVSGATRRRSRLY